MALPERQRMKWYQQECLEQAKLENIIVHLGTNLGKTLIAMRLIEDFLNSSTHRGKVAAIVVPSQILVDQHAASCKEQIEILNFGKMRVPRILKVVDNEQAGWTKTEWDAAIHNNDIFIATPNILRKAMICHNYIQATRFSIMVFDECHHATKLHPMAVIVRDGIHPLFDRRDAANQVPRLLGLTASFEKGSLVNSEQTRRKLEALFNARIVCPNVDKSQNRLAERVPYVNDEHHTDKQINFIKAQLQNALEHVGSSKEITKVVNASLTVFTELGRESLLYYVEHAIVQQVVNRIFVLKAMDDEHAAKAGTSLEAKLPKLREASRNLKISLQRSHSLNAEVPPRTPKLKCLLQLLDYRFSMPGNASNGYRGIVMVNDLPLVAPLAKQINDYFIPQQVRCGVVTGSRAQPMHMRIENMDAFRRGQSHILVATAAIEEGVDVPECRFSVAFGRCKTTKSNIQMTGRVRHTDAEHYYFENDPSTEMRNAAKLVAVAKETSLSLTKDERRQARSREMLAVSLQDRHPYPFGSSYGKEGGIVNIHNCKDIFMDYCRTIFCERSIRPSTDMYEYDASDVLVAVRYPSPEAWKTVAKSDVSSFWGDLDHFNQVSPLFTSCNLSLPQKRERLFVYVVVIQLRKTALLTAHNLPAEWAIEMSKQCCTLHGSNPMEAMIFKHKATFDDNAHSAQAPVTNHMPLASSAATLKNYLQLAYQRPFLDFDDVFDYETKPKLRPVKINYPTPNGWQFKTYDDFAETFRDMSIGDQLPSTNGVQTTAREKIEIGMMYLVVMELRELDLLDDAYLPCLSSEQLLKVQLLVQKETQEDPLPDVIEMSVVSSLFSVSDMSISNSNVGQTINGKRNDNNDKEDISMAGSQGSLSMMQVDLSIDGTAATIDQRVLASGGMMVSNNNASSVSGKFDDAESDMGL